MRRRVPRGLLRAEPEGRRERRAAHRQGEGHPSRPAVRPRVSVPLPEEVARFRPEPGRAIMPPGRSAAVEDRLQNALRLIVALAVSGVSFYYATQGTDWGRVGDEVRRAHVGWCLAVIAVSIGCHTLRAQRWRWLLRPVGRVPLWPAMAATFLGFGANAVLPLRLGELIRPAFLSRRVGIPFSPTLSSIVIERIFDTLLVICLLL